MANASPNRKPHARPIAPRDFMPSFGPARPRRQTPAEMRKVLTAMFGPGQRVKPAPKPD